MAYTGICLITGLPCPGGPESCEVIPQPTNPEVCLALDGNYEEDDNELKPPGGPEGWKW